MIHPHITTALLVMLCSTTLLLVLLPLTLVSAFYSSSAPLCLKSTEVAERATAFRLKTTDDAVETTLSTSQASPWSKEQLEEFASQQGVVVSLTTLGPGFRGLARSKHNETQILGYVEGFVRGPSKAKILHLDKMEVFRKMIQQARTENEDFRGGGSTFGVGLLVGYLCVLHGVQQGCSVAEFLAIDDDEYQHKRLVRYYKNAGFDCVKYVGDDWRDVPDRLVWGGCGTLLKQDIPILLGKWTKVLERQNR